jgi:hypothetical protein
LAEDCCWADEVWYFTLITKVEIWRNRLLILIGAFLAFYAAINAFMFLGGKNFIAHRMSAISGKKVHPVRASFVVEKGGHTTP